MKHRRLSLFFVIMLFASTIFAGAGAAQEVKKSKGLDIVGLGDSITIGYPAPGETFADHIAFTDDVVKFGKIGGTSLELAAAISADPSFAPAAKKADAVTLAIGSNDFLQGTGLGAVLLQLKPAAENPQLLATLDMQKLMANLKPLTDDQVKAYVGILTQIIAQARQHSHAPIIVYNLYNPINTAAFGPQLQQKFMPLHAFVEAELAKVNSAILQLQKVPGVYVADAYSAFKGNEAALLMPLDIHPNAAGHKVLAGLADGILKNALAPVITLSAHPAEQTVEHVTVTIKTSGHVEEVKILAGQKSAADFAKAGTPIKNASFSVTENGYYSVYARNLLGSESVSVIKIENIIPNDGGKPGTPPGKGHGKVYWDGMLLKPGQIGKLKVSKPINLWKREGSSLVFVRILKPGETYRVYSYDGSFGGQYGVGSGFYVTKMEMHIHYTTPSKAKLIQLYE